MKAIYFPHTFISASVAAAIRVWFPSVVGYQAVTGLLPESMRSLAQSGFLEVMAPDPTAEEPPCCGALIRELEQWGSRHHGGAGLQPAFLYERRWADPFHAGGMASELTAAIRRQAGRTSATKVDSLAAARIFMHLAQAFDAQTHQSEENMERFQRLNTLLFETLTGKVEPAPPGAGLIGGRGYDDRGDYLLERRIEAWVRLFLSHPYPSPAYITHHPAVIERLLDKFPRMLQLCLADLQRRTANRRAEATWTRQELISRLELLACLPEPVTLPEAANSLSGYSQDAAAGFPIIHLVPGIPPLELFARLLPEGAAATGMPPAHLDWRHTVIVQMA
jgi:hypothetical protein